MNVNDNERKVLKVLADEFSDYDGGHFFPFSYIGAEAKLDRRSVRLACRSLKRKGLAKFAIGLWTEDGEMRGSGYSATKEGAEFADRTMTAPSENTNTNPS